MTQYCTSGGDYARDIASLIATVDCDVTMFVERAYRGLFGGSGYMAPILIGALTIYVALYGYRLMAGRGVSGPDLTKRFIMLGVVLAFSSNWPAYQTVFVTSLTGGAEEIARVVSLATAERSISHQSIAISVDHAIEQMTEVADSWSRRTPLGGTLPGAADAPPTPTVISSPAGLSAPSMLWVSAILFGVSSAGILIVTKAALALMLALGPLFLMLGVFPETRGLTEGWLRLVVSGALILASSLLAAAGALAFIAPAIDGIAADQALGVNNSEPVLALLIICIVFALLMRQIISSVSQLVAAWRLPETQRKADTVDAAVPFSQNQPPAIAGDPRIVDIVAAASRDSAAGPARASIIASGTNILSNPSASDRADDIRRAPRAYRGFGSSAGSLSGRLA
ncbi:MAG: type IV secretion system protein [Parvularculaceae bacterium]